MLDNASTPVDHKMKVTYLVIVELHHYMYFLIANAKFILVAIVQYSI